MAGRKKKVVTDPEEIIVEKETAAADPAEDAAEVTRTIEETVDAAEDVAEDAAETVVDAAEDAVEEVAETADEVIEDVVDTAEDAAETVTDTAEEVAEGASEAVEDAAEGAAETVEDAAEEAADAVEEPVVDIRKSAAEKAEAAKQKYEEIKNKVQNWVPNPQLPNQLTIARVCMIPVFVALLLWMKKPAGNILAMIVFILASLTDAADGYIARRFNYVSTFGKFMDPLADKLLVCSALICLVDLGRIESWIVIIIIAREFIISGFRLIAVEKGIVIAANIWGKFKTVCQMLMVILMVGNFGGAFNLIAQILKWIALALTLISLVTYIVKNKQVLQQN